MKKTFVAATRGKARFYAGSGFAAMALAFGSPAYAQDAVDESDPVCLDEDEDGECDPLAPADAGGTPAPAASGSTIIVSGSRIARPNLDSTVPVTSVAADEVLNDGSISLGDALNDLPSLRSTFSTSNSQRFIGTTGLNILDLRGLGTTRTLTLVNGRRHITSSVGDFQVDVNTIPFELLERVDVVTGGSSAVYGSDAIAGVVNFVLKRDYDGIELNAQGGMSERGDNGRYSISGAIGRNFADGRGNIAFAAEYTKIESVLNSQRPEISGNGIGITTFVTADSDDELSNSDGTADTVLQSGLFYDFISEGGTLATFCLGDPRQALSCPGGLPAAYRFNENGRLFREFNEQQFDGSFAVGGTGSDLSDGSLIPDIERYNINLLGHFDVSDAFRPYFEAKYARIDALGQGTPTFFNSFCGGGFGLAGIDPAAVGFAGEGPACADDLAGSPFFIRFDNPFLNSADADVIRQVQDELFQAFVNAPPGLGAALSQGFFINRNNTDFGTRNDSIERETYRAVVGVEGDIASNTSYDLSFTYGRFESHLEARNQFIFENARNAVDAARAPDGTIQCRINVDGDATNDDAACVPINILGFGNVNQAALDYLLVDSTLDDKAEQYDVLGFINTDSSPFFELPGGPVSLVLGGEFRREEAYSEPDALSASGATFFNAFSVFDPPALEVYEAFGEIQIPILANMPFAEELTLSGAGRVSDYNSGAGNTGTVYAYNGNIIYAPIPDIRFRANFSRAVRSPTLSNLFSPSTENFLFLTDPCEEDNIDNGTATREANCRAAGVPPGFQDPVTGNRSVNQGGNPLLEAETSDSYTIGAIFEPRFLPGFSATVDYYNIEVNKVIANISGNQILANCFDAPSLDNQFCDLVADRLPDGSLPLTGALDIAPVNFAKLKAEGIDFDVRYSKTFDNDDRISLRGIATYVLDRTDFLDVDNPELPNRVRGELGDPELAFNVNASYRRGPVTFSYSMRWIGEQFIGAAENYEEFTTECTTGTIPRTNDTCTIGELVTAPPANPDFTAEVNYPVRAYHDIRVDFRANDDFNFYAGVDNVTDKLPPFALTGAGAGSGIFDNTGRFFYAGVNVEF